MSTRSIYHKACPSCAAPVELETTRCDCGFVFEAQDQESNVLPDDQTAKEQELYREYLNARLAQAVDDLESIRSSLVADPKNFDKANRLMKAYVALHDLRSELDSHSPGRHGSHRPELEPNAKQPEASTGAPKAFRAAQARKAEEIMRSVGISTKECPKCQAVLPDRAALCFCGYHFAQASADSPVREMLSPSPDR